MIRKFGLVALLVAGVLAGCTHGRPVPSAATATPAADHNFIVFFDRDSTDLSPQAEDVVRQIASEAKTAHPKTITVTGEDDGGLAHDAEIASQRGEHVAAALIAAGIDPSTVQQVPGVPPASARDISAHKVVIKFVS